MIPLCASSVPSSYVRRTHAEAESSQYNGKIRGCHRITLTTIYTEDTTHIRRHKETRNIQNTIYWHHPGLGLHKRKTEIKSRILCLAAYTTICD
jgi:hypothetical protein